MFLKKITLYHLVPAFLAVLICFAFIKTFPPKTPDLNFSAKQSRALSYILHFEPYRLTEQVAFSMALKQSVPLVMGSSELTSTHLKGLAHNFFNKDQSKLISIGHAGFQSMGILAVLAANRELLQNAKITIILSPGW